MTKREKIRILKAMLPLIDSRRLFGICYAYQIVTKTPCYTFQHEELLIELGLNPIHITKRPEYDGGSYWYPITKHGDNQRRAAIRRAIKRLENKKQ